MCNTNEDSIQPSQQNQTVVVNQSYRNSRIYNGCFGTRIQLGTNSKFHSLDIRSAFLFYWLIPLSKGTGRHWFYFEFH